MSKCSFCLNECDGSLWKEYIRCDYCKKLQKLCKKDNGIYYHIKTQTYFYGVDINLNIDINNSDDKRLLVLDFHNVCDLFKPDDLYKVLENVSIPIIILSHVGTTTQTRINAHHEILEYKYDSWFCFKKKNNANPGTKGHFMSMLKTKGFLPILLDDSQDNIDSALSADCKAHLILDIQNVKDVIQNL